MALSMTLNCFEAVIKEVVDNFELDIDMQSICTMEIVMGHQSEVQGRQRLHKKGGFQKGVRSLCKCLEWSRKLLPFNATNTLNASQICNECLLRNDARDANPRFMVAKTRRTRKV